VTRVPRYLLVQARAADIAAWGARPGVVARVADAILRHLPVEAPGDVLRRHAELVAATSRVTARPGLPMSRATVAHDMMRRDERGA
jgi:hypothetical protein